MDKQETQLKPFGMQIPIFFTKSYSEKGDVEEKWYVEGMAAMGGIDRQNQIISDECMQKMAGDLSKNSTVFLEHDTTDYVGKIVDNKFNGDGIWVKILVSKTVPKVWKMIREGVLNSLSVRLSLKKIIQKWSEKVGKMITEILDAECMETSFVGLPANAKAKTLNWYVEKALDISNTEKGGEKIMVDFEKEKEEEKEISKEVEKKADEAIPPVVENKAVESVEKSVKEVPLEEKAQSITPTEPPKETPPVEPAKAEPVKEVVKAEETKKSDTVPAEPPKAEEVIPPVEVKSDPVKPEIEVKKGQGDNSQNDVVAILSDALKQEDIAKAKELVKSAIALLGKSLSENKGCDGKDEKEDKEKEEEFKGYKEEIAKSLVDVDNRIKVLELNIKNLEETSKSFATVLSKEKKGFIKDKFAKEEKPEVDKEVAKKFNSMNIDQKLNFMLKKIVDGEVQQ